MAFFHEAFFDYAFARRWVARSETLVQFLIGGDQELFRRAQVRQILTHLHDEDPARFIDEAEGVLTSPAIRFHLKDVVLALLQALPLPTTEERQLVERLIAVDDPSLAVRLWAALRTSPWFERLDQDGVIARWLASSDEGDHGHALDVMAAAGTNQPD